MILVTGGNGQVATELADRSQQVIRVGRPDFDFDRPETIASVFGQTRPSLVVNAAAWTAVDAAETEEEAALRANRDGPSEMTRLCATAGVPLIHLSTDYVFDGQKGAPYIETDPTCPTGVYGSSKLAGERVVLQYDRAIVLRTSWVYAAVGKNFVRTMLAAAQKTNTLKVVADQQGCPTNAADLANAILAIAERITSVWRPEYAGLFHAAGTGSTTWHGLAMATFEEAVRHGYPIPTVIPISTVDWPTPAKRPADSRLDCTKLAKVFDVRLPSWRPSLARTVDVIATA
jgi:dTDP-4-dehydrorhamnose reductase